ncbi:hypothetical protein [Halomarina rubra]|uniref:Uncharacterized protein n=1 Tax=Halomarina rubra TaxID=2071873 RepID=A0ABD6AW11_9EURY|nr:hypothetical protein [Halomarina rubra]
MQRRAAAVLFVFFLVMGASAYSVISVAEEPAIELPNEQAYGNGTNFTEDGQEYRVLTEMSEGGGGGGHGGGGGGATAAGTLQWYVPEVAQNQTYDNGTAAEVFNGTYLVTTGVSPNLDAAYVNASGGVIPYASAGQAMSSGNDSGNASGGNTTGTAAPNATNASGGGANVSAGTATPAPTAGNGSNASSGANAANASNGSSAGPSVPAQQSNQSNGSSSLYVPAENTLVFTNTTDLAATLESDSAVYNETVTSEGQAFVRYRSNGSFVPLSEYLPRAEQTRVQEGDSFQLQIEIDTFSDSKTLNVSATVANVTNESAVIEYTAPQYNTAELESGANVTLANGDQRVVNLQTEGHGNDTSVSAQFGSNYTEYSQQAATQESYHDRITGLWNVLVICSIAGMLVIGLAFLPVRG